MTALYISAGPPIFLLLACVAIGLIVWGLRGRKVHDRPVCARCRFDVTGIIVESASAGGHVRASRGPAEHDAPGRCPECGASLVRPNAVRQGLRRRRPIVLTSGIVLLLLVVSGVIAIATTGVTHASIAARMPASVLVSLSRLDPKDAYIVELAGRIDLGETDAQDNALLAARLLPRLSDQAQVLPKPWNEVLASLYRAKAVSDADIEGALSNILTATLRTRDRLRSKGQLSIVSDIALPSWESPVAMTIGAKGATAEFRDASGQTVARVTQRGYTLQHGRSISSASMTSILDVPELAPGKYDVELTVPIVACIADRRDDFTFPIEIPVRIRKQIDVIAHDQTLVRVDEDADRQSALRSNIEVSMARVEGSRDAPYFYATVTFKALPVTVAYRVYGKPPGASDDQRIALGSLVARANPAASHRHGYGIGGQIPASFESASIDLIFEPDLVAAERDIDVQEITGANLRIDGVAVDWTEFRRDNP